MLKVMIVDDSRIFRKMLKAAFVETGHEVIGEAGNGEEILELLGSAKKLLPKIYIEKLSKNKNALKWANDLIKVYEES